MSIRNHTTISLRVERDTELKKTRTTNCAHVLKKPRRTEIIIIIIIPFSTYTYNTRVLSRAVFLRVRGVARGGAADDRERSRRSAGTRRAEITAEREFTEHGTRSFSVFSRYAFVEREALVGDGGEGVGDGVDNFRAEVGEALSRARCNFVVVVIIIIIIGRGGDGGGKE